MHKKQLPIKLLKIIQPFLDKANNLYYKTESKGEYLIKFVDVDVDSVFFFEITDYNADIRGEVTVNVSHQPASESSVRIVKRTLSSETLDLFFNKWVDILNSYTTLRSPDEADFIQKQYEEEFLSEFEILDEDADEKSYDYPTQKKIDALLEQFILKLDAAKDENNVKEIEELKADVTDLKNNQTKFTKRTIVQKLSKIWAKGRKISLDITKFIATEVIKEATRQVVKAMLSNP